MFDYIVYSCLAITNLKTEKVKTLQKKIVPRHSVSLHGCVVVMKPVAKTTVQTQYPNPNSSFWLQDHSQNPRTWDPLLAASQHTAEETAAALLLLTTGQRPNTKALKHTVDTEGSKQAVEKTAETKTAQLSFR